MTADKCQIFHQIDTITFGVWPGMPKLPPKNKFAVSLQYLEKEVSDEINFLHADKHESLLQIEAMTLIGIVKHSQNS